MKDNKSEQQSSDEGQHASASQATRASSHEEGHYLELYYSLLGLQQREVIIQSQLVREMQAQQITYTPQKFMPEMEVQIQEKTANFQAIQLSVTYGHFNTKISLINVYTKSPVQVLNESFCGSFGVVYKSTINHCPIAIKTAKIFPNKFQSTFCQIIKEYFLLKIAAALKIGPKIIKNFGFDIAIFKDSFVFGMEFCEMSNYKLNGSFELLRRKLHLLHILRLVHLDLKPQNIAFSPAFDQYVFIDFGLSRVVCQPLGSKTLVAFTGSFNYCCPEMLELYLKDQLGYVNLYYNDAFCLQKSMKYLSQLQVQVIEEMLFVNKPNFQQLIDCEILLKIKLVLFQSAVYFTTNIDIFLNNQRFIKKKLFQLNSYAMMLPQSLTIINLMRKHLKMSTNVEGYGSTAKDETIGKESRVFDEAMVFLSTRFHMIENYQDNQHVQQPSSSRLCACMFLHDQERVKNTRLGLYKLAFITYVRLNSYEQDFAGKIGACILFSELYMDQAQEATNIQLYRACVRFIFESALTFTDPEDWLTLNRAIETVTILEIIPEDQLLQAFARTINQPLKFFDKMSILFEFIYSAEYINEKFKTGYNYSRIILQMSTELDKYLDSIAGQIKKDEEKEIFMGLKYIISRKIPCVYTLDHKAYNRKMKDQGIDWKIMHQSMLYHTISSELMRLVDLFGQYNHKVFKLILIYINSTNYYYPRFTCSHLVIYNISYTCNQTSLNRAIYSLFYQQLKEFQEHKHFKIYLLDKLITIKDQQSKDLLYWRYSMTPNLCVEGQQVLLQEIYEMLNHIMQGQQFRPEIGYIFNISNLLQKPYLINIIDRLIDTNRAAILKLSYKFHEDGPLLHNNKLRKQIIAKNNIFQFIGKRREDQQYDKLVSAFILQCQELISQSTCFQCKLFCYLQLKLIEANTLVSLNLIQESFLLVLDIFIVYVKNTAYFKNSFAILICLLKKWKTSNLLYKKYDLQGFLYETVHENQNYQHCLIDIREFNLFLSLYLYIAKMRNDEEMVKFILNIITLLLQRKSLSFVNNFYYSIVYMIRINTGRDLMQFKVYHDRIVERMLEIPNLLDYKFIALYFSALLEVKMKTTLQSKMLKTINLLLNSIDSYTKSLILNRYFYNIAFYIISSKRKQSYLCMKHMKYCQDSFTLKFILRRKLRHWVKCGRYRLTTKMKNYIERYHYNIGNVQ